MKQARKLIQELEGGFHGELYDDETGHPITPGVLCQGHPTIGYGRALDTNPLKPDEAEYLFDNDYTTAWNACVRLVPGWGGLAQNRQAVLLAMAYQLGEGGLAKFRKMLDAILAEDWNEAEAQMMDSVAAREQSPGRYKRLRQVWRGEDLIA